jgi:hypothetical protein
MQIPFLNSLAEYVAICMGVVEPELFQLNGVDLEKKYTDQVRDDFRKMGVELDVVLRQYQMRDHGTLFYNRWKVIGHGKRSYATDQQVRDFITQKVRADGEEILGAADFEEFFSQLQVTARASSYEQIDMPTELRELFVEKLQEEKLQKTLLDLSKTKWYPALDAFYRR